MVINIALPFIALHFKTVMQLNQTGPKGPFGCGKESEELESERGKDGK